jgi:hypothetical protein
MPWTISDVERHKKGLSDTQKRQWVAVVNSVYDKCIKDGGNDSTCAASAIRQANGVAGNQVNVNTHNTNYVIRETFHQGNRNIIVPVVMMVEGVHNGSLGPLYHPAEELGKFPDSWNGIPVVIDHPLDANGINVSANSPEILETAVGKIFNAHMDGARLVAEAYLDALKLQEISVAAYTSIINGQPLEVSIGVFTDQEDSAGLWNNERYSAIARNHRPDHLALLPGGTGACSWNDGCGVRVNSANKKEGGKQKMDENPLEDKVLHLQNFLSTNMDQGYKAKVESAQRMLDAMDSASASYYLEEMDGEHIIYSKRSREQPGKQLLKCQYEMDTNGVPTFVGNPQEVKQKVEYVPLAHIGQPSVNNKGGKTMNNDEKPCGHCMEKVIAIIGSNSTHFTAADREWLLTQEEAILDKLLPKEPEKKEPVANAKPVELTAEQVLNAMSAEDKAALAYGRKQLAERRKKMVQGIQANTEKDLWPEAELNTMSEAFLEKLYNSVVTDDEDQPEVANYALNGGYRRGIENNSEVEALYPVGVEIEKK